MVSTQYKKFPDWQYEVSEEGITMIAPSEGAIIKYLSELRLNPNKLIFWKDPVNLYLKSNESTHRYRVPLLDSVESIQEESDTDIAQIKAQVNPITLKPDSDYQRMSEWLLDKWSEGKSVCVTSQIDNKCLFQNDKLKASRAVLQPHEFIGQNYLWYWRDSMADYQQLRQYLDELKNTDYLSGFEYLLRRPDGLLCRYATDYYRGMFLGVPVRIGVSNPDDWEIVAS